MLTSNDVANYAMLSMPVSEEELEVEEETGRINEQVSVDVVQFINPDDSDYSLISSSIQTVESNTFNITEEFYFLPTKENVALPEKHVKADQLYKIVNAGGQHIFSAGEVRRRKSGCSFFWLFGKTFCTLYLYSVTGQLILAAYKKSRCCCVNNQELLKQRCRLNSVTPREKHASAITLVKYTDGTILGQLRHRSCIECDTNLCCVCDRKCSDKICEVDDACYKTEVVVKKYKSKRVVATKCEVDKQQERDHLDEDENGLEDEDEINACPKFRFYDLNGDLVGTLGEFVKLENIHDKVLCYVKFSSKKIVSTNMKMVLLAAAFDIHMTYVKRGSPFLKFLSCFCIIFSLVGLVLLSLWRYGLFKT